ncbi:hypothetical protein ABFS82_04G115100 [Erythranthe guttata]|uniref:Germin-like protein n=1 Tax=Erythranthe guttata TaxID=4155 RepID=A0A022Q7A3_ERYGU|nr:PREDICTED: germin-like protein subfamily 3 member 4 [Erythranthe guttata]EYU24547.1 hypothetical protein MIMGU_mgv1a013263mg [Erythranthe guttata]|eukprot:XP_012852667.1 PREDICTED: germin-like protein subfamily 3 member 4 [Erythranthe guttata]
MRINKQSITPLSFLTFFSTLAALGFAGDGDSIHDFCPTDAAQQQKIFINGLPCKNPVNVTSSDFKSSLLSESGDTDNFYRSSTTIATAAEFPGLNALGLSASRTDMEADGNVAPHAHPRASEIIFVRSGVVVAGFVDSNNRVFQKRMGEGDVFVFPKGLLHYCFNGGFEGATFYSVMNSQNPGLVRISGAMFAGGGGGGLGVVEKLKSLSRRDLDGVNVVELFGE